MRRKGAQVGAVDTDGLMDRCEQCGARAKVVVVALGDSVRQRGECSECAEIGPCDESASMAAILWNKRQRMAKFARECNVNAGVMTARKR
jgi:hypothetical protein